MNHVIAIVIKFVTGIIAYTLALDLFFDATWVDIVTFSLLMTIVTYLLGDIILLPRIGNGNSLIADFLLSYMLVWIFGSVLLDNYIQIGWGSIISATIIVIGEVIVHRLLIRSYTFYENKNESISKQLAYSMEFAKDDDPLKKK